MYWLAEQGLAPKRAFLAGFSLLLFVLTEFVKNRYKGELPMKKDAIDVLKLAINGVNAISGNLAGGALLANTLCPKELKELFSKTRK